MIYLFTTCVLPSAAWYIVIQAQLPSLPVFTQVEIRQYTSVVMAILRRYQQNNFVSTLAALTPLLLFFVLQKVIVKKKVIHKGSRIYHRFSKEGFKRQNEYLLGLGPEIKACFFGITTIYFIKRFVISLLTLLDSPKIVFGLEQSFYNLLLDS